jgi:hypothetical protein
MDPLPEFGSGGPVGSCCHRLTAARGGEARDAGGPGGGPTGSQGHDNDESEHNQENIKEYVIDGTTAGPDEAAGNGVRLEEEAEGPRKARIATAPCGGRSSWADTQDSEAEYDDDDKQGGPGVLVGAADAPGVLLEPRCTVKVRGGLKVSPDFSASSDLVWIKGFDEQLGLDLSDLGVTNPNVIVTYHEATCTVNYEFELPRVRAVACGLLADPDADSEAADCEVILDESRWIEALSTAKGQYKALARSMLVATALADPEDPLPLQALRQQRQATGPQAAVPAAAAGSDGQSVRRPLRSQRKKTKK